MNQKTHTPEQIINKLQQAEVELARGATVPQACKKIRVSDQTYYWWRAEYGGMRLDQAKRLKQVEKENRQLLTGNLKNRPHYVPGCDEWLSQRLLVRELTHPSYWFYSPSAGAISTDVINISQLSLQFI